jgi:hypothetical protein
MSGDRGELLGQLRFGDDGRSSLELGLLVAWLADHRLFAAGIERDAARALASVRFHDLKGSEFLSTVLHGELRAGDVADPGLTFLRAYLGDTYAGDFATALAAAPPREDEWHFYDRLAPVITRAWQAFRNPPKPGIAATLAQVLPFRRR